MVDKMARNTVHVIKTDNFPDFLDFDSIADVCHSGRYHRRFYRAYLAYELDGLSEKLGKNIDYPILVFKTTFPLYLSIASPMILAFLPNGCA